MTTRSNALIDEDWKQENLKSSDRRVVKEALVRAQLKQPRGSHIPNIVMDAVRFLLPELPELDKKWEGINSNTFNKKLYTSHLSLYDHVRTLLKTPEDLEMEANFRRPQQ